MRKPKWGKKHKTSLSRLLAVLLYTIDVYDPWREDRISCCSNSNICHWSNIDWRSEEGPNKWQLSQRPCVLESLQLFRGTTKVNFRVQATQQHLTWHNTIWVNLQVTTKTIKFYKWTPHPKILSHSHEAEI